MRKWLLVLDQVGHAALSTALSTPGPSPVVEWGPYPLQLNFIPRTTPVGHATISTGLPPASHRIQGRAWFSAGVVTPHRVEQIVTSPPQGTVFDLVFRNNLARRLRNQYANDPQPVIVAAATKNFIPFLLGAWDTDVSVYPRTIRPVPVRSSFAIDVVFDAFTPGGDLGVNAARRRLTALATALIGAGWTVSWAPPMHGVLGPGHVRHTMTWTVPAHWGPAPQAIGSAWRSFLAGNIIAVDDFYTDAITELFAAIPHPKDTPEIALQSCVATDSFGHWHGPSSAGYATALAAGINRARRLAATARVLVTSDHGGRDTPNWWPCAVATGLGATASVTTGAGPIALPPGTPVLEGDHLLGYGKCLGGPPVFYELSTGQPVAMPAATSFAPTSFHPSQVPDWIVLPDEHALITDSPKALGGGGSHGACERGSTVSPIDGTVPLWLLSTPGPPPIIPSHLDGVAATFWPCDGRARSLRYWYVAESYPMRADDVEPTTSRPVIIGGMMEDPSVASTAALYDALRPSPTVDPTVIRSQLRAWRPEVISLLRDLAPGREDQIFHALLHGEELEQHDELADRVDQILRDNIDLARMAD